jgi:quinolinate synthase
LKDLKPLQDEVRALLREKNALMLAHNYQRDEIQEIADLTGDSLGLSQAAAESTADIIVFCGVHFMAESAAILAPEKKVLLPRLDAGCPMADMITPEQLREEKAKRPGVPVVAYVNTSAEIKAESDICCTSANAVKVTDSLTSDSVYMVPDKNLAHYISLHTDKKVEWWDGYCPTHENLTAKDVLRTKAEHPGALFICHPECRPDVVELADYVCSTSAMYAFAKQTPATTLIIGTELGILWGLKKDNPDIEFVLPANSLICPNMKLTTLEDIIDVLKNESNQITVPEPIRSRAKSALDKMLLVPRD